MAAYFVAHYNTLDRSRIDEVTALMQPIDEKYGAEVIVGSPVKPLEGNTHSNIVIYKFKSFSMRGKKDICVGAISLCLIAAPFSAAAQLSPNDIPAAVLSSEIEGLKIGMDADAADKILTAKGYVLNQRTIGIRPNAPCVNPQDRVVANYYLDQRRSNGVYSAVTAEYLCSDKALSSVRVNLRTSSRVPIPAAPISQLPSFDKAKAHYEKLCPKPAEHDNGVEEITFNIGLGEPPSNGRVMCRKSGARIHANYEINVAGKRYWLTSGVSVEPAFAGGSVVRNTKYEAHILAEELHKGTPTVRGRSGK